MLFMTLNIQASVNNNDFYLKVTYFGSQMNIYVRIHRIFLQTLGYHKDLACTEIGISCAGWSGCPSEVLFMCLRCAILTALNVNRTEYELHEL